MRKLSNKCWRKPTPMAHQPATMPSTRCKTSCDAFQHSSSSSQCSSIKLHHIYFKYSFIYQVDFVCYLVENNFGCKQINAGLGNCW